MISILQELDMRKIFGIERRKPQWGPRLKILSSNNWLTNVMQIYHTNHLTPNFRFQSLSRQDVENLKEVPFTFVFLRFKTSL